MFRHKKGFFGFYHRLTLVLVFDALLCQSEDDQEASQVNEIESCSHAAFAWMKKYNFEEAVKDREQFVFNLLDCTKEAHKLILKASETEHCKTFDEIIPSEVLASVMDKTIPEAIKATSLNFTTEEQRLIILSVHLVHISHRIRYFSCLVNVWSKSSFFQTERHNNSVQRLHFEFKQHILPFLDSALMAQWKSDNTTILQNNGVTLTNMLNHFSTSLINLLDEISSDIEQNYLRGSWRFNGARRCVARLDEIKKGTLASKAKLAAIETLIKLHDGFQTDMFPSISDFCTGWNMLLMLFVLFSLGLHLILYTRS